MNQFESMILALGLSFLAVVLITFLPSRISPFKSRGGKSNFGLSVGSILFGLWPALYDSDVLNRSGEVIPEIPFFLVMLMMAAISLFLAVKAEKEMDDD